MMQMKLTRFYRSNVNHVVVAVWSVFSQALV